jgi:hypothetical protein
VSGEPIDLDALEALAKAAKEGDPTNPFDGRITEYLLAADPSTVLALIARVREAEELLDTFADSEACSFDHHGHCQAHGWFGEGPCNMARARALLARRADAP